MNIPWANIYMTDEESKEVYETVKSGWISMGKKTKQFEQTVSSYLNVKHAIAVNNGTSALDVALKVMGVQPHDEVIVPAMTYIATVNSVMYQHAKPVFVDIEKDHYNIDPALIEEKITDKTKAILSIGYGGKPQDFDALNKLAQDHGIIHIDDGAQSFGAEYKGKKCCTLTDIATASFHAAKLVTTIEGGMIFTNSDELEEKCRIIRNQGEVSKYHHGFVGNNYRFTDVQAAIGLVQFSRFDTILAKRKELATYYTQAFADLEQEQKIVLPKERPETSNCWFFYPIQIANRDRVADELRENGVDTRIAYPMPVNKQKAYSAYSTENYPVAEAFCSKVLNLPLYHTMTTQEMDHVVNTIKTIIQKA